MTGPGGSQTPTAAMALSDADVQKQVMKRFNLHIDSVETRIQIYKRMIQRAAVLF